MRVCVYMGVYVCVGIRVYMYPRVCLFVRYRAVYVFSCCCCHCVWCSLFCIVCDVMCIWIMWFNVVFVMLVLCVFGMLPLCFDLWGHACFRFFFFGRVPHCMGERANIRKRSQSPAGVTWDGWNSIRHMYICVRFPFWLCVHVSILLLPCSFVPLCMLLYMWLCRCVIVLWYVANLQLCVYRVMVCCVLCCRCIVLFIFCCLCVFGALSCILCMRV